MHTPTTEQLLDKHHIRPNKNLGQHFLHDEDILSSIIRSAQLPPDSTVLEVGPGLGILTEALSREAAHVHAIEFDTMMIGVLKRRIKTERLANISLQCADILSLRSEELFPERLSVKPFEYHLVANLPYSITSRFFRVFLSEHVLKPATLTVLIQHEVAQRICSKPPKMSLLSVMAWAYSEPSYEFLVPPEAFTPPPAVKSAVVHLKLRKSWEFSASEEDFFRVARIGFSGKRKQLRNTLSSGLHITKKEVDKLLGRLSIDVTRRAESLTLEEWDSLTCEIVDTIG